MLSGYFPSVFAEDKGEVKLPKTGIVFHSVVEKAFECLQIAARNGPKKIRALKVGQNTISRQHTRVLMTVGRELSEALSAAFRKLKTQFETAQTRAGVFSRERLYSCPLSITFHP